MHSVICRALTDASLLLAHYRRFRAAVRRSRCLYLLPALT